MYIHPRIDLLSSRKWKIPTDVEVIGIPITNPLKFYSGSFECIDDDVESRDLSVTLSNPDDGEIFYEAPAGSREGLFQLDESLVKADTRYALCFGNKDEPDETDNEFDVGFSIHLSYMPRTLKNDEIGPDAEKALLLVKKASKILQDWTNMLDHYEYVRNREALHQEMNDAILSRLSRWTYVEALLGVGMAMAQVLYWKRFFETRRYL